VVRQEAARSGYGAVLNMRPGRLLNKQVPTVVKDGATCSQSVPPHIQ
jgi:hypothetical protein